MKKRSQPLASPSHVGVRGGGGGGGGGRGRAFSPSHFSDSSDPFDDPFSSSSSFSSPSPSYSSTSSFSSSSFSPSPLSYSPPSAYSPKRSTPTRSFTYSPARSSSPSPSPFQKPSPPLQASASPFEEDERSPRSYERESSSKTFLGNWGSYENDSEERLDMWEEKDKDRYLFLLPFLPFSLSLSHFLNFSSFSSVQLAHEWFSSDDSSASSSSTSFSSFSSSPADNSTDPSHFFTSDFQDNEEPLSDGMSCTIYSMRLSRIVNPHIPTIERGFLPDGSGLVSWPHTRKVMIIVLLVAATVIAGVFVYPSFTASESSHTHIDDDEVGATFAYPTQPVALGVEEREGDDSSKADPIWKENESSLPNGTQESADKIPSLFADSQSSASDTASSRRDGWRPY
jgi:hypothetical protein